MKEQEQAKTNQQQKNKNNKSGQKFGYFLGNAAAGEGNVSAKRPPQKRFPAKREGGTNAPGSGANAESVKAERKPAPRTYVAKENATDSRREPERRGKKGKGKKFGNPVKIIFLGGVGEIGKNMTALEYGNDIIIIDAGLTFPDEELPGIDLVIPDIGYLVANRKKVRGVLITHGHEDHIGGLAYLIKEINAPVYATKLTLALADNKLREHRLNKVEMHCVKPKDRVKLGCFNVEFINVNHSLAGACALCIDTPQGRIFHSGDFKIDLTPVAGEQIDLPRISEIGREGVNLLLCESTNVERPGYTMSETVVGTTLDHLFSEHVNRRIIVATFASNVHRLQQIIDLAVRYRRKVALSGRSMLNVVDARVKSAN